MLQYRIARRRFWSATSLDGRVQAVEATAPGLDPGVEADSIIMLKTV